LSSTNVKIFIRESVGNIPTDCTELSTILNDSVEEGETEKELFVGTWVAAVVE
jgi:hypothetical protein